MFQAKLRGRRFNGTAGLLTESRTEQYDFSGRGENVVGRTLTVSPREGELYYINDRMIHRKIAKVSADIRTVSSMVCETCREAPQKLGILTDDAEWKRAYQDGIKSFLQPLTKIGAVSFSYFRLTYLKPYFSTTRLSSWRTFQLDYDEIRNYVRKS